MNNRFLATAILAVTLPVQASAQSVQTHDWSGLYGGAYTTAYTDAHSTHNNLSTGNTTGEFDLDGRMTGIALGYNLQQGQLVYGFEIDAGFGSIEGETDVNCSLGGCSTEITSLYTARGRLGYAYGAFLPYLTAGLAMANVEIDINDGLGTGDENVYGYALGLGTQYAVTDQFSLGAELLFMDFNSFESPVTIFPGSSDTVTDEAETDLTTLKIGASFHF